MKRQKTQSNQHRIDQRTYTIHGKNEEEKQKKSTNLEGRGREIHRENGIYWN